MGTNKKVLMLIIHKIKKSSRKKAFNSELNQTTRMRISTAVH